MYSSNKDQGDVFRPTLRRDYYALRMANTVYEPKHEIDVGKVVVTITLLIILGIYYITCIGRG